MKAVVFERFGEPSEVLSVREVPTPQPGPGEVRVTHLVAPGSPGHSLTAMFPGGDAPEPRRDTP